MFVDWKWNAWQLYHCSRVWLPNVWRKPKRRVRKKFQEFFGLEKDKHDPNVIPFYAFYSWMCAKIIKQQKTKNKIQNQKKRTTKK